MNKNNFHLEVEIREFLDKPYTLFFERDLTKNINFLAFAPFNKKSYGIAYGKRENKSKDNNNIKIKNIYAVHEPLTIQNIFTAIKEQFGEKFYRYAKQELFDTVVHLLQVLQETTKTTPLTTEKKEPEKNSIINFKEAIVDRMRELSGSIIYPKTNLVEVKDRFGKVYSSKDSNMLPKTIVYAAKDMNFICTPDTLKIFFAQEMEKIKKEYGLGVINLEAPFYDSKRFADILYETLYKDALNSSHPVFFYNDETKPEYQNYITIYLDGVIAINNQDTDKKASKEEIFDSIAYPELTSLKYSLYDKAAISEYYKYLEDVAAKPVSKKRAIEREIENKKNEEKFFSDNTSSVRRLKR